MSTPELSAALARIALYDGVLLNQAEHDATAVSKELARLRAATSHTNRRTPQTAEEDELKGAGAWLTTNERALRRLLAIVNSSGHLTGKDGELMDARPPFPIDYMRDSIEHIERMISNRMRAHFSNGGW